MTIEVIYTICTMVTFVGFLTTIFTCIECLDRRYLFLTIGIPVFLWTVSLTWTGLAFNEMNHNGGFREVFSTTVEVSDKTLANGGNIQIIEYQKDGELFVINVTKIFGQMLPKETKIKISKKEEYRTCGGLRFTHPENKNMKYEIVN